MTSTYRSILDISEANSWNLRELIGKCHEFGCAAVERQRPCNVASTDSVSLAVLEGLSYLMFSHVMHSDFYVFNIQNVL